MVTATSSLNDTVNATGLQEVLQQPTFVTDDDCVFHDPVLQVSSVRVTLGGKIQILSFFFSFACQTFLIKGVAYDNRAPFPNLRLDTPPLQAGSNEYIHLYYLIF